MADIAELGYSIRTGEVERANTSLDGMSGSADRAARSFTGMERSAMQTAARLAAMLVSVQALRTGIGTLASYSQEMSTVRAITQATASEFADLSAEARRLGSTTRFSASEAAQGMAFLARAGFSAEEALAATQGTLTLAQAGALGLGQAADIASNVLTGFRLEVEQTGRVVDVLAFAANNSNTTVGQLGEAMSMVAPVAAGLGVSIEETAAAIGALSDAGIQSTRAGTGLRRVLSTLESPTAQAAAILADLGLTTDQVRVSQVGLTSAMAALAQAGIDTGTALELFGDRGGPAFEVLSSSIPRVNELNEALQGAAGTAERISGVMDDNLNGALLAVRSASQEVVLAFGELSGTGLEAAARGIADGLRFIAANAGTVTAILGAGTAGVVAYRAALMLSTAGVGQFALALGGMTTAIGRAVVATRLLAAAQALFLGPVGIAVLVAASAGLAFAAMGRSQEEQARRAQAAAEAQDAHNSALERAADMVAQYNGVTRGNISVEQDARLARQGATRDLLAYQDSLEGVTRAARDAQQAALAEARANVVSQETALAAAQARLRELENLQAMAPSGAGTVVPGVNGDAVAQMRAEVDDLVRGLAAAQGLLSNIRETPVQDFDPEAEERVRTYTAAERSLERQLQLAQMRTDEERAVASALWDAGLALDSQGAEAYNIRRLATQIVRETERRAAIEEQIRETQAQAARQQQSLTDARERLQLVQIEDDTRRSIAEAMARAGFAMDDQSDAAVELRDVLTDIAAIEQRRVIAQREAEAAARAEEVASRQLERTRRMIAGAIELHVQHMGDLNALLSSGAISAEQFAYHAREAESAFLNMRVDLGDATIYEGILAGLDAIAMRSHNTAAAMRDTFAGFFADFSQGAGQAFGQAIVYGDNLGDTLQKVAAGALSNLIASVVEYGIQWAIAQALGQSTALATNAALAAQGAVLASAWAPAAAAVSLATFGANAAPAMAGLSAGYGLSQALALAGGAGFQSGTSWTGSGPVNGIAGVVHNREAVLNAPARAGVGGAAVDYMNRYHRLPPSDSGKGGNTVYIDARGATVDAVEGIKRAMAELQYRVEEVDRSVPARVISTLVDNRELSGRFVD